MHRLWVPTVNKPESIKRLVHDVGRVVDTPGFRLWYERTRCEGAPAFPNFWAYVRASLRYDVPGPELCEVLWRATRKAFAKFDAKKGNSATPVEGRFLKHWRSQFHAHVRADFGRPRVSRENGRPLDRAYQPDLFAEFLRGILVELIAGLTPDERFIIDQHYWEGRSLAEIAKMIRRRNSYVGKKHREILGKLKKGL